MIFELRRKNYITNRSCSFVLGAIRNTFFFRNILLLHLFFIFIFSFVKSGYIKSEGLLWKAESWELTTEITSIRGTFKLPVSFFLAFFSLSGLNFLTIFFIFLPWQLGLYQRREQFDLKSCKDRDFFEEPTEDFNPAFEEKQASIIIQSPIIHQPCERSADQEKQAPIVHHPYEPLVFYPGSHDINPLNDEAAKRDIYKSAIAAQARKRRLQLNRAKSYTALKKPCWDEWLSFGRPWFKSQRKSTMSSGEFEFSCRLSQPFDSVPSKLSLLNLPGRRLEASPLWLLKCGGSHFFSIYFQSSF